MAAEVGEWLGQLGLQEYAEAVVAAGYDSLAGLAELTSDQIHSLLRTSGIPQKFFNELRVSVLQLRERRAALSGGANDDENKDLRNWLSSMGLTQYTDAFVAAGYDDMNFLADLSTTDEADMFEFVGEEMKIPPGHRLKISKSMSLFRGKNAMWKMMWSSNDKKDVAAAELERLRQYLDRNGMKSYLSLFVDLGYDDLTLVQSLTAEERNAMMLLLEKRGMRPGHSRKLRLRLDKLDQGKRRSVSKSSIESADEHSSSPPSSKGGSSTNSLGDSEIRRWLVATGLEVMQMPLLTHGYDDVGVLAGMSQRDLDAMKDVLRGAGATGEHIALLAREIEALRLRRRPMLRVHVLRRIDSVKELLSAFGLANFAPLFASSGYDRVSLLRKLSGDQIAEMCTHMRDEGGEWVLHGHLVKLKHMIARLKEVHYSAEQVHALDAYTRPRSRNSSNASSSVQAAMEELERLLSDASLTHAKEAFVLSGYDDVNAMVRMEPRELADMCRNVRNAGGEMSKMEEIGLMGLLRLRARSMQVAAERSSGSGGGGSGGNSGGNSGDGAVGRTSSAGGGGGSGSSLDTPSRKVISARKRASWSSPPSMSLPSQPALSSRSPLVSPRGSPVRPPTPETAARTINFDSPSANDLSVWLRKYNLHKYSKLLGEMGKHTLLDLVTADESEMALVFDIMEGDASIPTKHVNRMRFLVDQVKEAALTCGVVDKAGKVVKNRANSAQGGSSRRAYGLGDRPRSISIEQMRAQSLRSMGIRNKPKRNSGGYASPQSGTARATSSAPTLVHKRRSMAALLGTGSGSASSSAPAWAPLSSGSGALATSGSASSTASSVGSSGAPLPTPTLRESSSLTAKQRAARMSYRLSFGTPSTSARQGNVYVLGSFELDVEYDEAGKVCEKKGRTWFTRVDQLPRNAAVTVRCGRNSVAVLTDEGRLYTWGSVNINSLVLGHNHDAVNNATPKQVPVVQPIQRVACGPEHMVAVAGFQDGTDVFAWGMNGSVGDVTGRLGHGLVASEPQNVSVPGLISNIAGDKRAISVGAGASFSLAVVEQAHKGEAVSFGSNQFGQLGRDGVEVGSWDKVPTPLTAKINVRSVTCGSEHAVAVNDIGLLYAWGCNTHGQCGVPTSTPTLSEPTRVPPFENRVGKRIDLTACGATHTLAVTDTGVLYTWGDNTHGQLGTGAKKHADRPSELHLREVGGRIVVSAVAAGVDSTAAVTRSGDLWMWGAMEQTGTPRLREDFRRHFVRTVAMGKDHVAVVEDVVLTNVLTTLLTYCSLTASFDLVKLLKALADGAISRNMFRTLQYKVHHIFHSESPIEKKVLGSNKKPKHVMPLVHVSTSHLQFNSAHVVIIKVTNEGQTKARITLPVIESARFNLSFEPSDHVLLKGESIDIEGAIMLHDSSASTAAVEKIMRQTVVVMKVVRRSDKAKAEPVGARYFFTTSFAG